MSETKHTPGPWRVDGDGRAAIIRGADMTIVSVRHRLPADVHFANARLIAAAPDMATFVERVLDYARECGDDALYAEADALLEKATGE